MVLWLTKQQNQPSICLCLLCVRRNMMEKARGLFDHKSLKIVTSKRGSDLRPEFHNKGAGAVLWRYRRFWRMEFSFAVVFVPLRAAASPHSLFLLAAGFLLWAIDSTIAGFHWDSLSGCRSWRSSLFPAGFPMDFQQQKHSWINIVHQVLFTSQVN